MPGSHDLIFCSILFFHNSILFFPLLFQNNVATGPYTVETGPDVCKENVQDLMWRCTHQRSFFATNYPLVKPLRNSCETCWQNYFIKLLLLVVTEGLC